MSISALSSGAAGLQHSVQAFDVAAAQVVSATTPAAPDTAGAGPPPAAAVAQGTPGSSLVEAQSAVLAAHNATSMNLATIRTAQAMYASSINLLSGG